MTKTSSDHNVLISNFNITWNKKYRRERVEMFNLKNIDCQKKFKEMTSEKDLFCAMLKTSEDINLITNKFINKLDKCISKCFKKIRISEKPNKEIEELFERRKVLKNKVDEESKLELKEVETKLAEKCAEGNYDKIKEELFSLKCEEGGINSGHLWKLKKKLSPKCRDPPTAMLDSYGNLITSSHLIEELAVETYKDRLKNRPIKKELSSLKDAKEELCRLRLEIASKNKTPPWTIAQLEKVLTKLKKNKSRDPMGYANEIFHSNVAGDDLKLAVLNLMNRIKSDQIYPAALESCNISSIFKNKGARNNFDFYRGIFRVPILRSILDRLIYNDEYPNIDEELSDSNVGARKNRNIRDNIFVLGAITNSVINGNEESIDVQVYDVEKCFDALWVQECINDLYETGLSNDKLVLLYLENQNANIAVKSSTGMSRRVSINNIVMQGTVWGSLFCTATMDKLGKLVYKKEDLLYKYKGVVDTPTLGMVDDILSVQKCSQKSLLINSVINGFIESKKLTLSSSKCNRIHISKKKEDLNECTNLKVHNENMNNSKQEKYLGDIVDRSGKIRATIEERKSKGYAIVAEILAILDEIPLGQYKMEIGLKLRQAMLINGVLFNSEAWHDVTNKEIKLLESVDEHLLRSLVKGHAKTPLVFLYLEAGAVPIRFLISCRRMIFLQTILKRDNKELTKRIYKAQRDDPSPGDFTELLKADFEMIEEKLEEDVIEKATINSYKKFIKSKVRKAAFKYLIKRKETHSKLNELEYSKLETQEYLTSSIFTNEDVSTLFFCAQDQWNVEKTLRIATRKMISSAHSVKWNVIPNSTCSDALFSANNFSPTM